MIIPAAINAQIPSIKIQMVDALLAWRTAFHAKMETAVLPAYKALNLIRLQTNARSVLQIVLS